MASDEIDEFSTFSSSIYYAIRNSSEKQKLLLNILSVQSTTIDKQETSSPDQALVNRERNEQVSFIRKRNLKPQPLFTFYSDIPSKVVEESPRKKRKVKITAKASPTRQLLITALRQTKKRITIEQKDSTLKKRGISKQEMKKRVRKKIQDNTIKLNQFIPEKKVVTKIEKIFSPELSLEPSIIESEPFPFTNLSEWLIWHHNYPELAFVREVYDPEQIPDKDDIEVFWVNIMNDPEFFNAEWRISGSRIDIDSVKQQKRPNWAPEWDIISSYTDGFSLFLEDVYLILTNFPNGLHNYRYPILQFALRGLLLLGLAYYDNQAQKWFRKGTREDLSRLKRLDQFVSEQDNLSTYRYNLKIKDIEADWYIGLVCYDLIILHSTFLKRFSQDQLSEDEKIAVLIEEDLNQIVSEKLSVIEEFEIVRVRNLRKKLEPR
ncbi:MAG: hypothetical protein ACFFC6_10375 [Promethearchaeota archaeon]